MDKYDIKKLVDETFIELGYVDVMDKEYIKKCVNNAFEKVMDKSYSHKPHLASLPFDLNTSNIDDLNSRLDEINSRMDKLWDLMNTISSDMSDLITKQKNFHKSDEELQGEALDSSQSIMDRFHKELKGYDIGKATINGKPNVDYLNINSLNELFEYSGMIDAGQADALMKTAGNIVDFAYEQTGGDDTAWSNRVIGIADDLRALADKHNVNNNSQGKSLEDYMEIEKELNDTVDVYRSTRSMYNDFKKEGIRTREKIDKVEKRNRDKKDN